MKKTGITRKIDELGRIVIPKEIRRNLNIRDGEELEIIISDDTIVLKKYSSIQNIQDIANKFCNLINELFDFRLLITDREKIIADSHNQELKNELLSKELINLIDERTKYQSNAKETKTFSSKEITGYIKIEPIITSINSIGLVIIISKDNNIDNKLCLLLSTLISKKIDID